MFPPGGGQGGSNPQQAAVRTLFGSPNPGGLAQGAAPGAANSGGAGATPPAAGSVGEHLAEAFRGIVANEPGAIESLQAFFMALQEAVPSQGQGPEPPPQGAGPSAMESRPTGFPGIAPGAAQSAPNPRGPVA
jgi:hypothetical protein